MITEAELAAELAALRRQAGLTKAVVARLVNMRLPVERRIPYQAIGEIECGKRRIHLDEARILAAVLDALRAGGD